MEFNIASQIRYCSKLTSILWICLLKKITLTFFCLTLSDLALFEQTRNTKCKFIFGNHSRFFLFYLFGRRTYFGKVKKSEQQDLPARERFAQFSIWVGMIDRVKKIAVKKKRVVPTCLLLFVLSIPGLNGLTKLCCYLEPINPISHEGGGYYDHGFFLPHIKQLLHRK